MGFSVQIPVPGQPFSSEGVKVGNDIAAIAQWGNGHILGTDLDPAAGILASQLDSSAQIPAGVVLPFSGKAAIPIGFSLADGRTLTRSNYPRGFDFATAEVAAGNPMWTVNVGAATFTVPNLSDRFVYSQGTNAIGVTGGEVNHTLSNSEMPVHSHSGATASMNRSNPHNHSTVGIFASLCTTGPAGFYSSSGSTVTGTTDINHEHGIYNDGGGGAHNNMPPYVVLALIVKV